jgi:hypothetical protein
LRLAAGASRFLLGSPRSPEWDDAPGPEAAKDRRMEFLALLLWLTLAGVGLLVLPAALTAPAGAIAALSAGAGVVVCILWIVLDAPGWTGWTQLGLAVVGAVGAGFAAQTLLDDRAITGSVAEEAAAGALGLMIPFYATAIAVTLLMASGATQPVV